MTVKERIRLIYCSSNWKWLYFVFCQTLWCCCQLFSSVVNYGLNSDLGKHIFRGNLLRAHFTRKEGFQSSRLVLGLILMIMTSLMWLYRKCWHLQCGHMAFIWNDTSSAFEPVSWVSSAGHCLEGCWGSKPAMSSWKWRQDLSGTPLCFQGFLG